MLVSGSSDNTNQINRFQEYLDYLDVKQHVIQGLAKVVHSAENKNINTSIFRSNVMRILELVNLQEPNQKNYESSTLLCKDVKYDYNYDNVRKVFSALWEDFLKLNSRDINLYKRMLIILHDKVMPHLTRPLLLTDFLVESYNVGGSISLLALNGVFHLMDKYHLEYPDFYQVNIGWYIKHHC